MSQAAVLVSGTIGIVVIGLMLVVAAYLDRRRGRRIEHDLHDRHDLPEPSEPDQAVRGDGRHEQRPES